MRTGAGLFSMTQQGHQLGPGLYRRARRATSAAKDRTATLTPEQLEHRRRSAAGEARRDVVQRLLAEWSRRIGVPHELLVKQLPQFLSEWGEERMALAIYEVERLVREDPRSPPHAPSWDRFQSLVHLLRRWRRSYRPRSAR